MKSITKAVFLSLVCSFVSVVVTVLLLYYLSPLLPLSIQAHNYFYVAEGLISSIPFLDIGLLIFRERSISDVISNVSGVLLYIWIVRIIHGIIQAVVRRRRLSKTLNILVVVSLVSCPFFFSWLIAGYIHPSSVIFSFPLCIYTVLATLLARATTGGYFIANPIEFKPGKLNPITINI